MQNVEHRTVIQESLPEQSTHERERTAAIAGGSLVGALSALGAVVLAILALAGVLQLAFTAIAIIAVGAALIFEGAAYAAAVRRATGTRAGAIGAEAIAGLGAIALGVLALVGVDPSILVPVSAIVLGAGILLGGSAPATLEHRIPAQHETLLVASGLHLFVGLGALVLGILAVVGMAPMELSMIAVLGVAVGLLLSDAAVGARVSAALSR